MGTDVHQVTRETLGTYSDWRAIAPLPACPVCGSGHLRSRDCPGGLEIECTRACGYRNVFSPGQFEEWFQALWHGML